MATTSNDDLQAIRRLQIAYGQSFDSRDAEGYAALFIPDARIIQHDGKEFPGSKAGKAVRNMPPANGAFHLMLETSLTLEGDEASGQCRFLSRTADGRYAIGYYDDRYRRSDTGWKFSVRQVHVEQWLDQAQADAIRATFNERETAVSGE
jgi:ketosteroid isomerase-like protein